MKTEKEAKELDKFCTEFSKLTGVPIAYSDKNENIRVAWNNYISTISVYADNVRTAKLDVLRSISKCMENPV